MAGVNSQTNETGIIEDNCWVAPARQPLEMLEPYDGKLSRTVLRGESGRKARDLPDQKNKL